MVTLIPSRNLNPEHKILLLDSGISDEVVNQRGYYSENVKAALGRLGFSYSQRSTPALVIPVWNLDGKIKFYQIRPNQPRLRKGKEVKYENPS